MASQATEFARTYCIGLIGLIADEAFESQRDAFITRYYAGDFEAFKLAANNGIATHMPTRDDLTALTELIRDTSAIPYDLGYEDKQYLAEVRTSLVDAFVALTDGDLDSCVGALENASVRLDWITYKRKRQDKRDYHNPFASVRPKFERLTMRANTLARRLGKVAISS